MKKIVVSIIILLIFLLGNRGLARNEDNKSFPRVINETHLNQGYWSAFPSPTTEKLNGIDMVTASDGWAVGENGTILHWDGSSWYIVPNTSYSIYDIKMVSSSNGWAIGRAGTILHWDGTKWSQIQSPTKLDLLKLDILTAGDGWAIGAGGSDSVIHWDGNIWSQHASPPTSEPLFALDMVSSSDGWIVGWRGLIYRYMSGTWNNVYSPTSNRLDDIQMLSSTDGWVVGGSLSGNNEGIILRWNGNTWSIGHTTNTRLRSISMTSPSDGWAVGYYGAILHWDGSSWSNVTSPTTINLHSIDMISSYDGWAVGENGTILRYIGPIPSPDFTVTAVEITQAIQDLDNSVTLIEGKRTIARVHVQNIGYPSSARVTAKLCRPNECLSPSNSGGKIYVKTTPDRGKIDDSFYFELPPDWLYGTQTMSAEVNPPGESYVPESSTDNNLLLKTINYEMNVPLKITLFGIKYKLDESGQTISPRPTDYDLIRSWIKNAYPTAEIQWLQGSIEMGVGIPGCKEVLYNLMVRWSLDWATGKISSDRRYYGIVFDGGNIDNKIIGCSPIGKKIAAGAAGQPAKDLIWDNDDSYGDWYAGHELGHSYGQFHILGGPSGGPKCGEEPDPIILYPDGIIGGPSTNANMFYGLFVDQLSLYPPTSHDVMTYCENQWISDFTFENMYDFITSETQHKVSTLEISNEVLVIQGIVNYTTNTASLDTFYHIPNASLPSLPITGTHVIKLIGEGGVTLAKYPFTPVKNADLQPGDDITGLIGEVVPWITGTQSIAIYSNTLELSSKDVSPNIPTINVISPNGGETYTDTVIISWEASDADLDPLTYAIQYSADDGLTWQAVTVGITNTNVYTLDLSYIPGSDSALIRVLASDGVNTGIDESDNVFSVPKKAPNPLIISPEMGRKYSLEQTIILVGEGNDIEDGTLGDAALTWKSSISGDLGSGRMLDVTGLPAGEHTITLAATDSDGFQNNTEIIIYIGERVYLPVLVK